MILFRRPLLALLLASLMLAGCARAPALSVPVDDSAEIAARLRADIAALADDGMMGRKPGTAGGRATYSYIEQRMGEVGLVSGTNDPGSYWRLPVDLLETEPQSAQLVLAQGRRRVVVPESDAAVYTPLKQRSAWCTLVGAVCGALPPVVGWTAVTGEVQLGAGMLFGVLFLWQIPHFLAIDWVYRRDYSAGGFRMVSSYDPSGALSGRLSVVYSAALIPISLLAVPAGLAGPLYAIGAMVLGLGYWGFSVKFLLQRTRPAARQLFFMSLAYLPLLLTILAGDPSA